MAQRRPEIWAARTTNQFVSYRTAVKSSLVKTGNKLVIAFESAFRKVGGAILSENTVLRPLPHV